MIDISDAIDQKPRILNRQIISSMDKKHSRKFNIIGLIHMTIANSVQPNWEDVTAILARLYFFTLYHVILISFVFFYEKKWKEFWKILLFCLPFDFLGHQPPLLWMWASSGPQVSWDRLFLFFFISHFSSSSPQIRSNPFQFVTFFPICSYSFLQYIYRSLAAKIGSSGKGPGAICKALQKRNPHWLLNIRAFPHLVGNLSLPNFLIYTVAKSPAFP